MSNNVSNEELEGLIEKEPAKAVKVILETIKKRYGFVPFIFQTLSRRPEVFIPQTQLASNLSLKSKALSPKLAELIALSAATALRCEYCIENHTKQAYEFGASVDEIFETMLISSFTALTSSEGVSFRKFVEFEKSIRKKK